MINGEVSLDLDDGADPLGGGVIEAPRAGLDARGCPVCAAYMEHIGVAEAGLELDCCRSHGTWLDAGELEKLRRLSSRPPARPWTCASCGERMEAQFNACWKCSSAPPEVAGLRVGVLLSAVLLKDPAVPVDRPADDLIAEANRALDYPLRRPRAKRTALSLLGMEEEEEEEQESLQTWRRDERPDPDPMSDRLALTLSFSSILIAVGLYGFAIGTHLRFPFKSWAGLIATVPLSFLGGFVGLGALHGRRFAIRVIGLLGTILNGVALIYSGFALALSLLLRGIWR